MLMSTNLNSAYQGLKTWLRSTLRNWRPRHTLISILLLGLLQSIFFAVVIPPWWHYDEPGHFEYVWLAANLPAWRQAGQYNQAMRLEMANSLTRYGWYKARVSTTRVFQGLVIPIGVPEAGIHPHITFLHPCR